MAQGSAQAAITLGGFDEALKFTPGHRCLRGTAPDWQARAIRAIDVCGPSIP